MPSRRSFLGAAAGGLAAGLLGCDVREYARRHGAKLRLSVGTGPVGGVYYVYGGAIARVISAYVPNVEATAEVSGASADNLNFLRQGRSDLGLVIAISLYEAIGGVGAFRQTGRVPALTIAALYPQYTHIVTYAESGIRGVADLAGKVVATGAPGSGTETMAAHMFEAAGLDPERGVRRQRLGVNVAIEALKDGKLDAVLWNSGLPTAPITDFATTAGARARLVPNAEVLPALRRRFGPSLYFEAVIPAGTYPHLATPVPTVGATTLLVVDAHMSDELAYEITRVLFDRRDELIAAHPAARALTLESAVVGSPAPFHPGAIRFYKERGAWRG